MTRKSKRPKGPKIALAATVLAAPIAAPAPAAAQRPAAPPRAAGPAPRARLLLGPMIKRAASYTVAGVIDGHTVFRASNGTLFYLDPKTGDEHVLARGAAFKHVASGSSAYPIEHGHVPVTLLGVDARGHTIMRTAAGETFYLDATTGDMVIVK